jgi:cysteinyl-tRNA synthetase
MRGSRDGWNVTAEETARFEWGRFNYALDADFNLPEALSLIRRWVRLRWLGLAYAGLAVFGLTSLTETGPSTSEAVVALAVERSEARAAGEWHLADDLRQQIESLGFEVRDVSEPPGFLLVPIDKTHA